MFDGNPGCLDRFNRDPRGDLLGGFRLGDGMRPVHGSVIVQEALMIATPPATFTVPDPLPDAPAKGR